MSAIATYNLVRGYSVIRFTPRVRIAIGFLAVGISAALPFASVLRPEQTDATNHKSAADPWNGDDLLLAAQFAKEEQTPKKHAPTVVYVGFRTLFEGGHIPNASFHGTASEDAGLADLKKWAGSLSRTTNLVIYCGCCPFDRCPNIRPAFAELHKMGFTHIRVLDLPTSFASDWVEKGYPMRKGI